jgi:hypothetical protein
MSLGIENADSDEVGRVFRYESGHLFRSEAGHPSEMKAAGVASSRRVVLGDLT